MNLEEKAREFVASKPIHYGDRAGEPLAPPRWVADFASEAVKAERRKIADELEAIRSESFKFTSRKWQLQYLRDNALKLIDHLRGERE